MEASSVLGGTAAMTTLGTVGGVECSVALHERPWELPIDALVVSVAADGGLGQLAHAVRDWYPNAGWDDIDLRRIQPNQPGFLDVEPRNSGSLTTVVLATIRDQSDPNASVTPATISTAAAQAISAAARQGATRIAIPILGAGAVGLPVDEAADMTIDAVRSVLASGVSVETVVFVCRDAPTNDAICDAWNAIANFGSGPGFSRCVRDASGRFTGPITASAFVAELCRSHADYAAGMFATVTLDPTRGETRPIEGWLDLLRMSYDSAKVASSSHRVIDGRLAIRALAELDHDLADTLGPRLIDALEGECAVEPRSRYRVRLHTDDPVSGANDSLGRSSVAAALVGQLDNVVRACPHRSFLVHLDGAWGSGKSTLLRLLEERVAGMPSDNPWVVVHYDAWRQSKGGPPWLTLLQAVRGAVYDSRKLGFGRIRLWVGERARLIPTHLRIAGAILAVAVAVVAALFFFWSNRTLTTWSEIVKIAAGLFTVLSGSWLFARAIGRHVSLDSQRAAATFVHTRADPMEDLAAHFAWLINESKKTVLIIVDDVDRCPEPFVVDLLDAIQKLVRDRPTAASTPDEPDDDPRGLLVVVAADGRWIRTSYERSYAGFAGAIAEPGASVGSLFLEKLFQLSVPVPILSDELQRQYLSALLRDSEEPLAPAADQAVERIRRADHEQVLDVLSDMSVVDRVKVSDAAIHRLVVSDNAQREIRHALERFAPLLDPTPRAMKRFVMTYSMLWAVRLAEGSTVGVGPLALWTVLVTRWPLLAEHLQNDPSAVDCFRMSRDQLPESTPAELVPLFCDPPAALRAVMNHRAGPLDARRIRESSGQARSQPHPPTVD